MTMQVEWKRCSDELPELCNHAVGPGNWPGCVVKWSDDCWVCTGCGAISVGHMARRERQDRPEWVVSDSGIELLEIDWTYIDTEFIEYWAPFILPEPPEACKS